jgi:hypothetical protein
MISNMFNRFYIVLELQRLVSNGSNHTKGLRFESVSLRYALTIIYETRSNSIGTRHTCVQDNLQII